MAEIIKETPVAPRPADERIDISGAQAEGRDFIEDNQKTIIGVVAVLVAIAAGIFLYRTFVLEPAQREAASQMWRAQQQFERDSFALALTNPAPGYLGFVDIADEYSNTEAGELAGYYAGLCYLQLGKYEAAVSYLEDYDPEGEILPGPHAGALGDAYAQLGDMDKAESQYQTAVDASEGNSVAAPYFMQKLAMLKERNGNTSAANALYVKLRDDYPNSTQALEVDKYILRTAE